MPGLVYSRYGATWRIEVAPLEDGTCNPLQAANYWLTETLKASGDLTGELPDGADGIWYGNSPRGTNYPSVSYWIQTGEETQIAIGSLTSVSMLYVVEGWDQVDHFEALYLLWPILYNLLNVGGPETDGPVETAYGYILACSFVSVWAGQTNSLED